MPVAAEALEGERELDVLERRVVGGGRVLGGQRRLDRVEPGRAAQAVDEVLADEPEVRALVVGRDERSSPSQTSAALQSGSSSAASS